LSDGKEMFTQHIHVLRQTNNITTFSKYESNDSRKRKYLNIPFGGTAWGTVPNDKVTFPV
jgi:hypothetical protein